MPLIEKEQYNRAELVAGFERLLRAGIESMVIMGIGAVAAHDLKDFKVILNRAGLNVYGAKDEG